MSEQAQQEVEMNSDNGAGDCSESSEDGCASTNFLNLRSRLIELFAAYLSTFVDQETEILVRVRRLESLLGNISFLEIAIDDY